MSPIVVCVRILTPRRATRARLVHLPHFRSTRTHARVRNEGEEGSWHLRAINYGVYDFKA